jgi:hypothetical protein
MSETALTSNQSSGNLAMHLPISSNSGSNSSRSAMDLFQQFGQSNVQQSVDSLAASSVSKMVNSVIDSLPMPDFMKDAAKAQVAQALSPFQSASPAGLDAGVKEVLSNPSAAAGGKSGSGSSDPAAGVGSIMGQAMQDEMEEASSGSSGGGAGGNWLAILARALGSTAGEHLKKMVELGDKMGELDSTENPEEFAQFQSEFQAESQIFKMFQEAIGTMVKSIGEGMSTVARKQ